MMAKMDDKSRLIRWVFLLQEFDMEGLLGVIYKHLEVSCLMLKHWKSLSVVIEN
ncbi:hypothetical protein MTR_5g031920 [Medicago truncatula]|uniref:Uncharacterized protein n=1 Tax=Medicago truncatula TaxID=3880 RepID=G7JWD1_MEDTR|nr:hypothetical protein MTR_5g031920 [Medicago truncatula]